MRMLLANASVYVDGRFQELDVAIDKNKIESVAPHITGISFDRVFDLKGKYIIPGLVDVHVHLREPGFSYKETIKTGTLAAAAGGYTAVCAMPNLIPAPDSAAHVSEQLRLIERDAVVRVYPYGTITAGQQGAGELSDIEGMKSLVCGYSDDGRGVKDGALMERAMREVKRCGGLIAAHCEDTSKIVSGGCVHDGEAAMKHGVPGISSESEWAQIERDIELALRTGCPYHVCHISTKESVELIRRAKADGANITCETAPHYLALSGADILDVGRFKMNPPIRDAADRDALVAGLVDGTIDMIATDHAPHSAHEKSNGLVGSAMGVVGLETALGVMYERLVKRGTITMDRLIELMCTAPRRRFKLPGGMIAEGEVADIVALDLDTSYTVEPDRFLSMGRATPFEGDTLTGRAVLTIIAGEVRYDISDC